MTNKRALQLLRKEGFDIETTADGHVFVRDGGRVIGKMRQHGEAHLSLQKFIHAGFPRGASIGKPHPYVKLETPDGRGDDEGDLAFWLDE